MKLKTKCSTVSERYFSVVIWTVSKYPKHHIFQTFRMALNMNKKYLNLRNSQYFSQGFITTNFNLLIKNKLCKFQNKKKSYQFVDNSLTISFLYFFQFHREINN